MSGASDFFGWQLLKNQLANDAAFTVDLAKEIGKSYCRIQQKYPVQNRFITNPAGLPIKQFCNFAGIPPAVPKLAPPPFTGGQCPGVQYRVTVEYNLAGAPPTSTRDRGVVVYGKVLGVSVQDNSLRVDAHDASGNFKSYVVDASSVANGAFQTKRIIGIFRIDGQPDNCGNPEQDFIPDPPPDINDYSQTYNFSYETNEGDVITEEYTINYDNSDGSDFYFPIVGFIADVDFNADIEFNLDLGGITINRRGGGGSGSGSGGSDSGSGGGDYGDNLPAPNEDNSEETQTDDEEKIFIKQPKPPEEESQDTGLERLDYITIDIIQKPSNAPRQDGAPGDDICFPGFAEFKSGGYNYPRVPLHFERNILRAPDGADGYAVRFYPGYKGQITVYTRKKSS